jgi:CMP-N,N'-diacetyllegionaminic acid synthase
MKNILITVCGRAGSKGVKNKNIRNFLGKPLLFYTLDIAKEFKNIKKDEYEIDIAVNSDSEELLDLAANHSKIYTVKRIEEHAGDNAAKVPVIIYTTEKIEEDLDKRYDYVIDLDITSPMRTINDIENGLNEMENGNYDCVFSVVEARRNPYFNMVKEENGKIRKVIESNFTARQQAPKVYDMNASIYVYNRKSFKNNIINSPLEGISGIFEMKDYGVLDIDSEQDFQLMEIIYKNLFGMKKDD